MPDVIPLFPLSHVLLPGMPLPLHIFEQRYRDLLSDIADAPRGPVFGVVSLRTGTEAAAPGSEDDDELSTLADVEAVGTLAEILEIETAEDGTSDLLSVGSRRFRVLSLVPLGKPYLRAEIEYLDEQDGPLTPQLAERARELIDVFDAMLVRIAGRPTGTELPDDDAMMSYQLASRLPLPPHEKQELLEAGTTADRLRRLATLLRREIALLQQTRTIAVSPAVLRLVTGSN